MTRQQKLAASEIKYQLSFLDSSGFGLSANQKQLFKDGLVFSYIEVFRYTCKSFNADKFRDLCEGPFVPSVHDKLCGKKPMTKEKRVHYGIDEEY